MKLNSNKNEHTPSLIITEGGDSSVGINEQTWVLEAPIYVRDLNNPDKYEKDSMNQFREEISKVYSSFCEFNIKAEYIHELKNEIDFDSILDNTENESIFFNSLCTGLSIIEGYGIYIEYDQTEFDNAKNEIRKIEGSDCYEDILMQLLRNGGKLKIEDEDGNGEFSTVIKINDIHERVKKIPGEFIQRFKNNDIEASALILQIIFFNKIIFG